MIISGRPWQGKILARAVRAMEAGRAVLLDAPTGSGKTLISLLIAKEVLSHGNVDRAYFAVRTINEMAPYQRDVHKFSLGLPYSFLVGKKRTCPWYSEGDDTSSSLCESCLSEDTIDGRSRMYVDSHAIDSLLSRGANFAELGQRFVARDLVYPQNVCLHHSLKELSDSAPCVVMTYPYLLSEGVRLASDVEENLGSSFLVLDEAHNVEDIACSLFERRLSAKHIMNMREEWRKLRGGSDDAIDNGLKRLEEKITELAPASSLGKHVERGVLLAKLEEDSVIADAMLQVSAAHERIQAMRREIARSRGRQEVHDPFVGLLTFLEALQERHDLELFVHGEASLALKLVDPSKILEVLNSPKALLMMSGTLPTMEYVKRIWGITREIEEIRINRDYSEDYHSVFLREAMSFTIDSGVTTKFAQRSDETWEKYAGIIERAFRDFSRSVLVCCPSYDICEKISIHLSSIPVFVERRDTDHEQVMRALSKSGNRLVIMAVARGKLLEGVEFLSDDNAASEEDDATAKEGSLIDAVVIAGIPYPVPDDYYKMKTRARAARIGLDEGSVFEYFSRQPALIAVRQALGRAIRTPDDKATIILADQRFFGRYWKEHIGLGR
jgi:DNA excision repair protein ERCC-2